MNFCTQNVLWQGVQLSYTHTSRKQHLLLVLNQVPSSDAPFQVLLLENEKTVPIHTLHVIHSIKSAQTLPISNQAKQSKSIQTILCIEAIPYF